MDNHNGNKEQDIIVELARRQGKSVEDMRSEIDAGIDAIMNSDNPEIQLLRDVMLSQKNKMTIPEYLELVAVMNYKKEEKLN